MKTYDLTNIASADPQSLPWALTWVRLITSDKEINGVYPSYSLEDEEWEAFLDLTKESDDAGNVYYLPFEAVAIKVLSDPTYAEQINEENYSQSFRSATALAEHLRITGSTTLAGLYPAEVITATKSIKLHPRF